MQWLEEPIWINIYFTYMGKPKFFTNWVNSGIKYVKDTINDIRDTLCCTANYIILKTECYWNKKKKQTNKQMKRIQTFKSVPPFNGDTIRYREFRTLAARQFANNKNTKKLSVSIQFENNNDSTISCCFGVYTSLWKSRA
jgi:hypothetical protein